MSGWGEDVEEEQQDDFGPVETLKTHSVYLIDCTREAFIPDPE
jgi:hypothetical protein